MKLKMKLVSDDKRIPMKLKETYVVSDGGYERGYEEGYEVGHTDGVNSVPPNYTPYMGGFNFLGAKLPDDMRDIVLDLPYGKTVGFTGTYFCRDSNLTSLTVKGENFTGFSMYYTFMGCADLKYVDFSQCGNGVLKTVSQPSCTFYGCTSLESIIGELDFSDATQDGQSFYKCTALKELRVTPLSIKYKFYIANSRELSAETIQSIIDGLADMTGQTTLSLDFHTTILSKLTEDQVTQLSNKNWRTI